MPITSGSAADVTDKIRLRLRLRQHVARRKQSDFADVVVQSPSAVRVWPAERSNLCFDDFEDEVKPHQRLNKWFRPEWDWASLVVNVLSVSDCKGFKRR